MPTSPSFLADLAAYGPQAPAQAFSLPQAQAYCEGLARRHYENFQVASWLLPRRLRPHFYAIYAYCRWADDLADETPDAEEARRLLDWWEGEVRACFAGQATHPAFVALEHSIRLFSLPIQPFLDLLDAFRQDQQQTRYRSFDELLEYCRRSANPVGRLLLHLAQVADESRCELSDHICTGLQLANFCQDVAEDWRRGRIYLPLASCRRHGFEEADFARGQCTPAFQRLLACEVSRAEAFLRVGLPLADRMPPGWAGDIWLFAHGGLKVLAKIRAVRYDVWTRRPRVSRVEQFYLLAGCIWKNRTLFRRNGA